MEVRLHVTLAEYALLRSVLVQYGKGAGWLHALRHLVGAEAVDQYYAAIGGRRLIVVHADTADGPVGVRVEFAINQAEDAHGGPGGDGGPQGEVGVRARRGRVALP